MTRSGTTGVSSPRASARQVADAVVVGAGPYGLSIAAHARAAGLSVRIFGEPMSAWTRNMPAGMLLKSEPSASHLAAPDHAFGYDAYCVERGLTCEYGQPIPVEEFAAYGVWFAECAAGTVERRAVARISGRPDGFTVTLDDGVVVAARAVVLATGAVPFAYTPPVIERLPAHLAGHASDYPDLGRFHGRRVAVLGAGQSALETAALLNELGARPELIAACAQLEWNDPPLAQSRQLYRRVREPRSALGSGLRSWGMARAPGLVRQLPEPRRARLVASTLGPAGAWWLRERLAAAVPSWTGTRVVAAHEQPAGGLRLALSGPEHACAELSVDHVIAATGYRVALDRLTLLDPELRGRLAAAWTPGKVAGPRLSARFESCVPGLYFAGLPSALAFGPLMRFVAGAGHTARAITRDLCRTRGG